MRRWGREKGWQDEEVGCGGGVAGWRGVNEHGDLELLLSWTA